MILIVWVSGWRRIVKKKKEYEEEVGVCMEVFDVVNVETNMKCAIYEV